MRTIIVLAVFAILLDTWNTCYAELHEVAQCAEVEVQPKFDSERYFKGTWYVTHAQHGRTFSVCRTVRTKLQPNGTLDHTIYAYRINGQAPEYYKAHCHGKEKKEKGRLSLNCPRRKNSTITIPFHVEISVMETDYNHYAIIYKCIKGPKYIAENILVYNRKQNDTSKDSLIAKSLTKKKLVFDDFISRRNVTCAPHPEE